MMTEVPHVLKGFLIVAILSAAMSSVSSALTSLASVSTMDFVKGQHGTRSEEFYLNFSKRSTVAWAVILIFVAYLSREVAFVLNAAFTLRGMTSGALLGGLMLAVFWKNGRAVSVITGMIAALLVMIGVSQFSWDATVDGKIVAQKIFWPWFTLIGAVVTLTVAWGVNQLVRVCRSPLASLPTPELEHLTSQSAGSLRRDCPPEVKAALSVFCLDETTTLEDVRQAYRELVKSYHPDKVAHLGADLRRVAEAKTKEINGAFVVLEEFYAAQL